MSGAGEHDPYDDEEPPIGELLARLIDEGKAYGRAEIGLARAHAEIAVERVKRPAISIAIALGFALAGMIALVMTLVLSLAAVLGPLVGGLVATALAFALAGLFLWLALRQWKASP